MSQFPIRSSSPVKLIAIDIDGTLLPSTGTIISERNRLALRQAQKAGVDIVIATGRRQAYAAPLIQPIGLNQETVLITSNGTIMRTLGGERMERAFLPLETARGLCGVLRQFGGTTVFTFDRDGKGELVIESLEQLHARIALWVEANRPWLEEVRPLEGAFDAGESPVQGMICGTLEEMDQAEEWLAASPFAERVEMHQTRYPARNLSILDILPPGCSKGVALQRLSARRGLRREEVMAVGDNYNDLEMLKFSGHPVLMGNASSELLAEGRDWGWHVAPTNDEDGVAQVIEDILCSQFAMGCDVSMVE
ncbi:HAD family phosphatase [Alloacidobacterium dinghuense]|uniref:HAD family phosphatase n=1 Tax=Alloacidobacterium dinghuense TaxID=2763107 RepID=A0A7G8BJ16_9BACT|nr:Cof-type HAD-IIB family hydrolase [Alloacidobacterium dinghuense]QNI32536.1 HAD family phosphatase [Alloacidobacterium dinghuense]